MGFDSKKSLTKVNEDSNMANQIWVEVMELKPIEVKKAPEERARGEGQTPFSKIVK
jgi:membrane carboxypeptidase/penicillin-binding protein